ncbi:flagellar motor protein MotA [Aureimonas ureilytica]|uniref:Flagellar motor protein MotA n=1 Tax=Aureimonas ureilytica TaxID=401562 RepID=A0A175R9Y1_9HYPH|nr:MULTISPECIES: hypothetical protein [Aureimonas]KTQ95444.1 flagellar motor protein MotA [Aureimonas ureilytica]
MQVFSPTPEAPPPAAPAPAEPLSSPLVYLGVMLVFLALAGFVALILGRQVQQAFFTNPGLNGLILGVLAIGILLSLGQILKLSREVRWVNGLREGDATARGGRTRHPVLLSPMEAMMQGRRGRPRLPLAAGRSLLDSVATRLDEARDTSRYLIGLLVFLGLLGTFWGLLTTIGSISATIQSLDPTAGDAATVLDSVKNGLSAPLSGMGTAFSSSLFGLSGSMVLGFLDLQVGRAQNRFYTELEDLLSFEAETPSLLPLIPNVPNGAEEFRVLADRINRLVLEQSNAPRTSAAMASLAESIQGLVQHMRGEQQLLRDFVEAQAGEQREMRRALERLNNSLSEIERN